MSIRWVTSMLSLLLAVTIMVTAGLSWNVYSSFTKMVEADVQYQKLLQVSRELLQSSYTLTRKAREYVNTGGEAFERVYYDILAQRSGRMPRKGFLAEGESISLPSLMERYGASRGDMAFLGTALRRSDELSATEIKAMQAIKGETLRPDGLHGGSDKTDAEYARRILFDASYQKQAGEIIALVESGIANILERKFHEIEADKHSAVNDMKALGASIGVVFLIALIWIWYGVKKVSQPLRETTLFAHRVAEGEAESSIAVRGHDEIAELRAMLNIMLGNLQKNAHALRELSYIDPLTALWNRRRFREVRSVNCGGCRSGKERGSGWRSSTWTASRASTIRSATPPGIWCCGSSRNSPERCSPPRRRSRGLGGTNSCCSCPDADENALSRQLEAIRKACTAMRLVHADREVRFSISAGGYRFTSSGNPATPGENEKMISDLFRHADTALYMSKQAGRDRVTLWIPGCSFPCPGGFGKEQSFSGDV